MKHLLIVALMMGLLVGCQPTERALEVSEVSLEADVPQEVEEEYASDAIHKAAHRGDLDEVLAILATNPDVDARDSFGGTPLHAAMFQDNIEVTKALIDYGYDVNAKGTSNGYTPLHDAVWSSNLEAIKVLVENGADLSLTNNDGDTPQEKASRDGKIEVYELLKKLNN